MAPTCRRLRCSVGPFGVPGRWVTRIGGWFGVGSLRVGWDHPTPRRRGGAGPATLGESGTAPSQPCCSPSSSQQSLPLSAATVEASGSTSLEATIQATLDDWVAGGPGGVAVAYARDDGELVVLAAGTDGPSGGTLERDSEFRVGSLAKTFIAVMLLQLVSDGTIGLDDVVTEHAPELTIAQGITIRQLLAHRSGLAEHTDGELAPAVLADPARSWTPQDVLDLVAEQPRDFPPGERFAYSNTNYIVAGLLLEQVTDMSTADNLRTRIVEPLGLTHTYLAPDGARQPIGAFSRSLPGGDTDGASYHAIETAAGAAGAVVSTAGELATFIRALAHGELLPAVTYAEMIRGFPADGESLGIFPSYPPTTTGISNSGAIPGFSAYMQYEPATEDLFVLLLNEDVRSPEPLAIELETAIGHY